MSGNCTIKAAQTNHGVVVQLEGKGTFRESQSLDEFVTKSLERGDDKVVVDLDSCSYLDSTFLGCLLILHRRFGSDEPRRFLIIACAETQKRLLAVTRLDSVLNCLEQAPEPIGDAVDIADASGEMQQTGVHIMQTHRELSKLGGPSAKRFGQVADQLETELGQSDPE